MFYEQKLKKNLGACECKRKIRDHHHVSYFLTSVCKRGEETAGKFRIQDMAQPSFGEGWKNRQRSCWLAFFYAFISSLFGVLHNPTRYSYTYYVYRREGVFWERSTREKKTRASCFNHHVTHFPNHSICTKHSAGLAGLDYTNSTYVILMHVRNGTILSIVNIINQQKNCKKSLVLQLRSSAIYSQLMMELSVFDCTFVPDVNEAGNDEQDKPNFVFCIQQKPFFVCACLLNNIFLLCSIHKKS